MLKEVGAHRLEIIFLPCCSNDLIGIQSYHFLRALSHLFRAEVVQGGGMTGGVRAAPMQCGTKRIVCSPSGHPTK